MRLRDLSESGVEKTLQDIEQYLERRKVTPQAVSTYNVRSTVTSSGEPAWSGTLPASPQSPSQGTKVLRVVANTKVMSDLFCRLITRLDVAADGSWYRPNQYLADVKAGTIGYQVQIIPEVVFTNVRSSKSWLLVINGKTNVQVFLRLWTVANDGVDFTITEVV